MSLLMFFGRARNLRKNWSLSAKIVGGQIVAAAVAKVRW
jgi:hypothetical protein